jgi:OmpA-OmpF porin, OOP family
VITLEGIVFGFDSDRIASDERGALESAADTLRRNPELRVEIAGHTDSMGQPAYNQALSERRARAVLEFLVAAGIDRDRLTARGYGQAEPVADNATEEGRARNRRVELRVLD